MDEFVMYFFQYLVLKALLQKKEMLFVFSKIEMVMINW